MIQRHWKKRVCPLLVAFAMTATLFFPFGANVHAAENKLPTKAQFATVDELKQFNTVSSDDIPAAKIYFGVNDKKDTVQRWWIAGSQNGNLTLIAASPLATGVQFSSLDVKNYDPSWNCIYPDGVTVSKVYGTYYGGSSARNKLREVENSHFTVKEQALMKTTTVYTYDQYYHQNVIGDKSGNNTISRDSIYSTTEKLYLPFGLGGENYVTVGNNQPNDDIKTLNQLHGLRVDNAYWNNWNCWIRTPDLKKWEGHRGEWANYMMPSSGKIVSMVPVPANAAALAPAFELNLSLQQSPVIFASAAPAATSTGTLPVEDTDVNGAFTLRYKADDLGSARVACDKSEVLLKDVKNDTYLVVQNSNGAWTKQITDETSVSAKDMGLESFENCKVWLERTDKTNRMTYATEATTEHVYKDEWVKNETSHWHECDCGAKADKADHAFRWILDKEPTTTEKGLKHEECSVCGYEKASVEIPMISSSNTDKQDKDKPKADKNNVKTDDQTNVALFASLLSISTIGIAALALWRKKKDAENR